MFKDFSSLSMFTQLTFIFSQYFLYIFSNFFYNIHIFFIFIVHQLRLLLTLTFVPLPYLFGQCHDIYVQFGRIFYVTFEDCIGLFISHYRSFLCQNLYQVIPLLLWQFSKCVRAPFHHKLAQHNFWEFIFNFHARCVSREFTTYSCLHLCQK